jgi:YegS/Rv2252/BmrU family lipid kinase
VALVGGDGTLNEAAQAFIDADGNPDAGPVLGVIPSGTGGDFRRTFGLGTSVEEAVARLMTSPPRPLDLGVVELTGHDGARVVRAFANIMSFGIGGLTDKIVNASPKWLGGQAAFFLGTLRAMAIYDSPPVVVRVDGAICVEGPIFNVAVANGRYFGGGMKIAPEADPSDGIFDVVALHDLTRVQGIALARRVYRGSHPGQPGVRVARGREVVAEPLLSRGEVLIDLDGETPGRLPLRARVVPGAISIRI